jgi:hypothetical protein
MAPFGTNVDLDFEYHARKQHNGKTRFGEHILKVVFFNFHQSDICRSILFVDFIDVNQISDSSRLPNIANFHQNAPCRHIYIYEIYIYTLCKRKLTLHIFLHNSRSFCPIATKFSD